MKKTEKCMDRAIIFMVMDIITQVLLFVNK